jgi:Zn-dependent protease with chaperone function
MDSGWDDEIPAVLITKLSEDSKRVRLGRTDMEGWSLILEKPLGDDVAALVPRGDGYGRWIDRIGLWPAVAAGAVLTVSIVAMGYLAPHWIAPHIPMSWERRLGSTIVGDFGSNRCTGADGQRALEALAERLEPGSTHGPDAIRIVALDVPMFNAVALPGGNIVVFQGAIDEVDDPDALAGIVAHEIAHVRRRHVAEALVRELGISAMIRMLAGNVGANAEQLLSLNYTRKNESEADSDAIATLNRVHISPRPTGELFQKLAKKEHEEPGFTGEFLQSHPLSVSRAKRFAAAEGKDVQYRSALTDEEFDALKRMCRNAEER